MLLCSVREAAVTLIYALTEITVFVTFWLTPTSVLIKAKIKRGSGEKLCKLTKNTNEKLHITLTKQK